MSDELVVPGSIETGLEDFEQSDFVTPRLTIDHKQGLLVNSLTKEEYENLTVVVLGLVKQRILWEPEVQEGDVRPLCKSLDHKIGRPDPATFPWDASGFARQDFPGDEPELPCAGCNLKEWDSHPSRGIAWCTEQYVLPVIMPRDESGQGVPAIFTAQRSGIRPARAYLSDFAASQTPPFTVFTEITFDKFRRGQVDYAVPKFKKIGQTPQESWEAFGDAYRTVRSFVSAVRRNTPEVEAKPASQPAAPASQPAAAAQAAPEPEVPAAAAPPTQPQAQPAPAPEADEIPF